MEKTEGRISEFEDRSIESIQQKEEKKRLTAIFTDRIITSPYKADRDSVQGMKNALVELYILAATRKIMGSAKSSFSLIASKIGHNPLELVVYEKK